MPEAIHEIWTSYLQAQDLMGWITQIYVAQRGWAVIGYEFIWLVLVWTLIPWRLSKGGSWFGRLWTQTWVALIYLLVAIWLIPASQWGEPYRNLLSFSLKALFKMLLA